MLRADLSDVGLLRRKDAESPKLRYLRLTRGTTLISCSGSIGRTVYTRPDMEGMWGSQDVELKSFLTLKRFPRGFYSRSYQASLVSLWSPVELTGRSFNTLNLNTFPPISPYRALETALRSMSNQPRERGLAQDVRSEDTERCREAV